ncbi:MAG TPA: hypothetical protein ENG66_06105 [Thermococcus sp.]|nr:hypothetical protein [Thermococcus sp.]
MKGVKNRSSVSHLLVGCLAPMLVRFDLDVEDEFFSIDDWMYVAEAQRIEDLVVVKSQFFIEEDKR